MIRPITALTVIDRRDDRPCTSYWTFAKGVTRILIGAQKGVEERSLYWLESHWITPSLILAVTQAQPARASSGRRCLPAGSGWEVTHRRPLMSPAPPAFFLPFFLSCSELSAKWIITCRSSSKSKYPRGFPCSTAWNYPGQQYLAYCEHNRVFTSHHFLKRHLHWKNSCHFPRMIKYRITGRLSVPATILPCCSNLSYNRIDRLTCYTDDGLDNVSEIVDDEVERCATLGDGA
jgi:hypothetical protein